jgi:outer membrane lipoprotein carrier protein
MTLRTLRTLALLTLSVPALVAQSSSAAAPSLKAVTDAVDHHYNHVSSMSADFTETYTSAGTSRSESGTLLLKKPGKMLWQYSAPHAKVFLSDGKTAYFYVPGEAQGRKMPVKKLDDFRSPLRYLLGHTQLDKEFTSLKLISSENGTVTLEGMPKGMSDQVQSVRLEIRGADIVGIRIEQLDGSVTEFAFRNEQDNVPAPDAKFRPDVPPDTRWIESARLQPE